MTRTVNACRNCLCFALFAALPLDLAGQQPAAQPPATGLDAPVRQSELRGDATSVPFTISATQILVDDVYVNGKGPFRFLLDTGGMGGGRVDASLVEKLGLTPSGEIQATDGTNRPPVQMPVYDLESLSVGDLTWRGVRVLSRDYNAHAAESRGHIDGILGFALLEPFLATVDYQKRMIHVERGSLPEPNGRDVLAMEHDGVPGIQVTIGGKAQLARFDTGSMGGISVSQEVAEGLSFTTEPIVVGEARTLSGPFEIKQATLKGDFQIGDHVLENPDITISGPMRGINVGGVVLRDFIVTYDQQNRRVRVVRNPIGRPSEAARRTRLGMGPVVVPMKLEQGRPTLDVTINGQGPFRFILDTGTPGVVLDTQIVNQLKLAPTGSTRIGDPSTPDAVEAQTYQLQLLTVGDARFEELPAIGYDGLSRMGIAGIVGTQTFYDSTLRLDFGNQTLTFARAALDKSPQTVEFDWDAESIVTIPISIGGQTLKTHVDTGNPGTLSIPLSLDKRLNWSSSPQLKGRAQTISSAFDVFEGTLDGELQFAGLKIANPTLRLNDQFAWGNLGTGMLLNRVLILDQVNRRLSIAESTATSDGASSPPPPRFGAALGFHSDGKIDVQQIMTGSPAERGGLKVVDEILSINGVPVSDIDQNKLREVLGQRPLQMTVQRGDETIELTFGT